jgi:hypothetical protein
MEIYASSRSLKALGVRLRPRDQTAALEDRGVEELHLAAPSLMQSA